MGKRHVKVNVFGIKNGAEVGMLELRVTIPPHLRHPKKLRMAYCEGVAEGVAQMMQHHQPEGDGLP